jgi:tetratricopeptide (TPR) repeat protein
MQLGELYGRYGAVSAGKDKHEEALKCYEEVLAVLQADDPENFETNYPSQSADAYLGMGFQKQFQYQSMLSSLPTAEKNEADAEQKHAEITLYFNKARDIHNVTGNKGQESLVLDSLGNFFSSLGQLDEARSKLEEALELRREHYTGISRDKECAPSFVSLAKLYTKLGDQNKSLDFSIKAKEAYTQVVVVKEACPSPPSLPRPPSRRCLTCSLFFSLLSLFSLLSSLSLSHILSHHLHHRASERHTQRCWMLTKTLFPPTFNSASTNSRG